MIKKIIIYLFENFNERNIEIDAEQLLIKENGNIKKIKKSDIDELNKIILFWNKEYINEKIIDSNEYEIEIESTNGIEKYHGKGAFPDNFSLFKSWIDKVC